MQCWEAVSAEGLDEEHDQLQWEISHDRVCHVDKNSIQAHRGGRLADSVDVRRLAQTFRQLP